MNIFLNIRQHLSAVLITVSTLLLLAFLFSLLYYLLPLHIPILIVFANFSLGISVFCGAFFLSRKTPFFQFSNVLIHTFLILFLIFIFGALFGDTSWPEIKKILFLFIASFLGEFCGNL